MPNTQRVVALMYTDVVGSTQVATQRGDEVARLAIRQQRAIMREQAIAHGGREVESAGDSFLAIFDSPRIAVACAVRIQKELEQHAELHPDAVRVRIGLNAGVVLQPDEREPFGAAIHATARLAAHARGGEILISDTAKQLAGTVIGISFRDRGNFTLKGFDDPWRLHEVVWRKAAPQPAPRRSWRQSLARQRQLLPELEAASDVRMTDAEILALLEAGQANVSYLRWLDEHGEPRILLLPARRDRVTIGRTAGSDVALTWDSEVSRAHAVLEPVGDGWMLVDNGLSANGSFVNHDRVEGHRRLRDRDRLRFGNTDVDYRESADAEGAESTARALVAPASVPLSETQRKVLLALCRPLSETRSGTPASNREIADELHLSIDAIKGHLGLLFQRFEVDELPQNEKRAQLARKARDAGYGL